MKTVIDLNLLLYTGLFFLFVSLTYFLTDFLRVAVSLLSSMVSGGLIGYWLILTYNEKKKLNARSKIAS